MAGFSAILILVVKLMESQNA